MVNIHLIPDAELEEMLRTCTAGGYAYVAAMEELGFRGRHPEYRVG